MKKESFWIWNMGDFEIFHSNRVNTRRQEYGADYPCLWRLYDVERHLNFYCDFVAEKDTDFKLYVNGVAYIMIDSNRYATGASVHVPAGAHSVRICITNLTGLPAAYIEGDVLTTGEGWYTIDENLRKIPVGYSSYYNSPEKNPEVFHFEYEPVLPVKKEKADGGILFDFGRELFGYLNIKTADKNDRFHISYGESKEEAVDTEFSLVYEDIEGETDYKLRQRAFRFIFVTGGDDVEISADYEYLPLEHKGSFRCDNEDVNKIWDMCAYTLQLTTREVQLEAIKRDRWLWGGDAYQAYKFSSYLFGDRDIIKRSTIALRGKEPVYEHINTITDYTFFWIIGLKEYLLYYNDLDFIDFIYPRAVSLMDFALKRVNDDGFIVGKDKDWIFIDWADIDKGGALCAEQMLCIAALRTMGYIADKIGKDGSDYYARAEEMTEKTNAFFWNEEKGAYIDTYETGKNNITRQSNIFAIMYDIASKKQRESIMKNVLLNDEIPQITTPYFEGYELDTMGMCGNFDYIENKIKTYWKGMLDLGATTVWEEYKPELSGAEHYAMYGGKYAKSLCHAWGASPIYLLGRYFLGVEPVSDGFESFTVKPYLGSFGYIEGTVPINGGKVTVYLSKTKLSVLSDKDGGTLIWYGKEYKLIANKEFLLEI